MQHGGLVQGCGGVVFPFAAPKSDVLRQSVVLFGHSRQGRSSVYHTGRRFRARYCRRVGVLHWHWHRARHFGACAMAPRFPPDGGGTLLVACGISGVGVVFTLLAVVLVRSHNPVTAVFRRRDMCLLLSGAGRVWRQVPKYGQSSVCPADSRLHDIADGFERMDFPDSGVQVLFYPQRTCRSFGMVCGGAVETE